MKFLTSNAHWLLRIAPALIGAIAIVHWGQWNFVPTESHPMGGFEFQAVLLLVSLYLVITGNRGIGNNQSIIANQGDLR